MSAGNQRFEDIKEEEEEGDLASPKTNAAYLEQAQKLSLDASSKSECDATLAKKAKFVAPHDAVVETQGGDRLPSIPVEKAKELNELEQQVHGGVKEQHGIEKTRIREGASKEQEGNGSEDHDPSVLQESSKSQKPNHGLGDAKLPETTNPLFPPLPLYGPSSFTRSVQCYIFRATSFCLSLGLLNLLFFGGGLSAAIKQLITGEKETDRPFYEEEMSRKRTREADEKAWKKRQKRKANSANDVEEEASQNSYVPTEGGKDPIVCDIAYYARRVGLDMEEYKVQTEDGFIIDLWHIYNPKEYVPNSKQHRSHKGPDVFKSSDRSTTTLGGDPPKRKYPVLMIHGLLQSSGAFCAHDDHSMAFYLAKSNYDVWLGNNRCGFHPEHTLFQYSDPRMWNWNIRQMGVLDLPALVSRVLHETGFQKLALVGHSQGTAQTFIALAKDQRPDLGKKISVFCALAPAAYAGSLVDKWWLKIFRVLSPAMYKVVFGIHAFIPFMMTMQKLMPSRIFGYSGYLVFTFMFGWSDRNWDRGVRDRGFIFAPVYISAEAMRWWLGKDGFVKNRCILNTQEECEMEDGDEEAYDTWALKTSKFSNTHLNQDSALSDINLEQRKLDGRKEKAWFDERVPPMALWVAGDDAMVDGRRLLRRFKRDRRIEPCVRIVKEKVIENYQHLDVIWAVDSVAQVGEEIKDVIWSVLDPNIREETMMPTRCELVEPWVDPGPITVAKES